MRAPSFPTFGSPLSRGRSEGPAEEFFDSSLTPVSKPIHDHEHRRSSLVPADYKGSRESQAGDLGDEFSLPIPCERGRFSRCLVQWAVLSPRARS